MLLPVPALSTTFDSELVMSSEMQLTIIVNVVNMFSFSKRSCVLGFNIHANFAVLDNFRCISMLLQIVFFKLLISADSIAFVLHAYFSFAFINGLTPSELFALFTSLVSSLNEHKNFTNSWNRSVPLKSKSKSNLPTFLKNSCLIPLDLKEIPL